jgi:hypothetical protein
MNIQHINFKIFLENPESVKLEEYPGIFNNWIQRKVTEELLVDVADYLHVHEGPGILLVGHEANYSLDNTGGRLGLLYNRKVQLEGATEEKLAQSARATFQAAALLNKENGLTFNAKEIQISVNDRVVAPNTMETYSAFEPELKSFLNLLFNNADYEISFKPDARERFLVNIKSTSPFNMNSFLQSVN